jgi:hypothetical protein
MTVKELIEQLKNCPQDSKVVIQMDPEGNGYRPAYVVDPNCVYQDEGYNHYDIYSTEWSAEEAGMTDEEEWTWFKENHPDCVVIA